MTNPIVERYNCYGWDIRRGEMRPEDDGQWVRYSDYERLSAELERAREENERWQRNSRETWGAFSAMRDAINEVVPMPSSESDLLQGPEISVSCETLASSVIECVEALRTQTDPFEMRLCETQHVVLKPNTLYRFTVDPSCPKCVAQAAWSKAPE